MSLDNRVTLLIPTKNRPFFLARVLEYYSKQKVRFNILVGDASNFEFSTKTAQLVSDFSTTLTIEYVRYTPSLGVHATVLALIDLVKTPYSLCTGDDDFLIPERVREGIAFLDSHPDYSLVGGCVGMMPIEFLDSNMLRPKLLHYVSYCSVNSSSPSQRLVDCFYLARNNTFDLRRTMEMKDVYSKTIELGLESDLCSTTCFCELGINGASIILGKGKKFSSLYVVMATHEKKSEAQRYYSDKSLFDMIRYKNWSKYMDQLLHLWSYFLQQKEGLSIQTADKISEIAFSLSAGPQFMNYYSHKTGGGSDKTIYKIISLPKRSLLVKILALVLRRFSFPLFIKEFLNSCYGVGFKHSVCLDALKRETKRSRSLIGIYNAITGKFWIKPM